MAVSRVGWFAYGRPDRRSCDDEHAQTDLPGCDCWRPRLGTPAGSDTAGVRGANEILGIGLIGEGSRGSVLLQNQSQIPGVAVRAICDIDAEHLERGLKTVETAGQKTTGLAT